MITSDHSNLIYLLNNRTIVLIPNYLKDVEFYKVFLEIPI